MSILWSHQSCTANFMFFMHGYHPCFCCFWRKKTSGNESINSRKSSLHQKAISRADSVCSSTSTCCLYISSLFFRKRRPGLQLNLHQSSLHTLARSINHFNSQLGIMTWRITRTMCPSNTIYPNVTFITMLCNSCSILGIN